MDISHVIGNLNTAQRQAVTAPEVNLLILAGAGSGKTRVLVNRIAWHIETGQSNPHNILAVTFTNKAAAEMRGRIENVLRQSVRGMWIGTFHSLAHRLLRLHWQEAQLLQNFQILDSEDQYRTIRRLIRAMQLDESQYPPREAQWFINNQKDQGLKPEHLEDNNDATLMQMIQIYKTYQETCQRSGLVDFAELLLRVVELFRNHEALRQHYQQRFMHVLVDEFQDTNTLQYDWLRLLVGGNNTIFAVGDDDQSVYSWRGAKVENMQSFQQDFSNMQLLKLEQNYRSTGTILKAANELITHNSQRLCKELWTESSEGGQINLYSAYNEKDEARYVIDGIRSGHEQDKTFSDYAILYRVSAQSRVLEEALMHARIPYRVYGGMRFYERAEIKDALAYVRLAYSCDDDASFERIVNTPTRGIGNRSLEKIRATAKEKQCSLWQASRHISEDKSLPSAALNSLAKFIELIQQMHHSESSSKLNEHIEHVLKLSGLIEHFQKEQGEKSLARVENLEELITAADAFDMDNEDWAEMDPLAAFLAYVALESGETQASEHTDYVHMMTLHSAKGLEFSDVYLVGMEEGLFPHQRSMDDLIQLEEERRLCYVGITRTQKQLTLSYTQHRRLYGKEHYPQPSRFINEIPPDLLTSIRTSSRTITTPSFTQHATQTEQSDGELSLGQRVSHTKFGEGIILNMEGTGEYMRIQVNFETAGCKWLVATYANLIPC